MTHLPKLRKRKTTKKKLLRERKKFSTLLNLLLKNLLPRGKMPRMLALLRKSLMPERKPRPQLRKPLRMQLRKMPPPRLLRKLKRLLPMVKKLLKVKKKLLLEVRVFLLVKCELSHTKFINVRIKSQVRILYSHVFKADNNLDFNNKTLFLILIYITHSENLLTE